MIKRKKANKKGGKMANESTTGTAGGASPCKPFSVNLAVLSPDDQTQVSFGISRHCPPSGPLYIIIFVLRTNETGGFQDRVKLEVTLGDTDNADAQAMVDRGLTMTQIQFLQGPITARAQGLPDGTTSDNKTARLLAAMPHLA